MTDGSSYPFAESIAHNDSLPIRQYIAITGQTWTVIQEGCIDVSKENIRSSATFNLIHRGFVRLESRDNSIPVNYSTAAAGARFEVEFLLDGNEVGWYARTFN